MSSPNDVYKSRPVLFGTKCEAEYIEQQVPSYRGNPLIEALPSIWEMDEVINKIANYPEYNEEQRGWSNQVRMHCVYQLKDFIQPMPFHLDLETRFSVMIRQGYSARNPLLPNFKKPFIVGFTDLLESDCDEEGVNVAGNRSLASGFCIIGPSGIGKSTALEKILLMYPQVLFHYKRHGMGMLTQVTWLKLDCPSDGSLKALCLDFFQAMDQILGSNYSKTHINDRSTAENLLPRIAQIASLHCLGVLVIDEIQNLNLAKSGGEERALNFFTKLVNVIGIPVVLVGTYKAMRLFNSSFAQARRASGMGDMVLDRILKDRDWDLLLTSLWDYQWTREYAPLTDELKTTLYMESQGIVDVAVKLFMLSQWKAISTRREQITHTLIKQAAEENLKLIRPFIHALRSGNKDLLMKYDDLRPDWLKLNHFIKTSNEIVSLYGNAAIEHHRAQSKRKESDELIILMKLGIELGLKPETAEQLASKIMSEHLNLDITTKRKRLAESVINYGGGGSAAPLSRSKNQTQLKSRAGKQRLNTDMKHNLLPTDVLAVGNEGLKRNIAAIESLSAAGYITNFTEFL